MSELFDRLGLKKVINGRSWVTHLGGSIMPPEVLRAVTEAANCFVDLEELHRKAGQVIARLTGAEAGLVTAGAAAGLVLQAAACMTGKDPAKISRLPDSTGMKNEILIQRSHRNHYDSSYRLAGAKLVEVGGPGMMAPWQLEAAINDNTAAVALVVAPFLGKGALPLEQVVAIAHHYKVPVIVDAAAELPPVENLTRFIHMGADMVTFSGGKGVRGPQSTGILCGRKDLIEAAFMNAIGFGSPHAPVGRAMKVCKEEIAGLVAALELFVETDHEAQWRAWKYKSQTIVEALKGIPGVTPVVEEEAVHRQGPTAVIYFQPSWRGPTPQEVFDTLKSGDPPIYIGHGGFRGELYVTPVNLQDGEEKIVAQRLKEALTKNR